MLSLRLTKNLGLDLIEMAKTMDGTFPGHIWAATARGYEWARIHGSGFIYRYTCLQKNMIFVPLVKRPNEGP